ncbi:phosphatidylglycerol lysyltransferase domain-containing protein [Sphingobacterium sp. LRF_L2]|uniref:phosphatidylglycerol lysyltransferase domain-containing protein n=1 Tax=Sphingobacterium sp. LRF_L2 TaxID=3369421 RepID=UPI003F61359F
MKLHLKANNYYFKEILAFLFLILAAYFFRKQYAEVANARKVIEQAQPLYVVIGLLVTLIYILLQAFMYIYSFKAVRSPIRLTEALRLFLKRNLVSVFLPGGGVTSLAFFTEEIERKGISKNKIGFASYIFGMAGIASLAFVALPVIAYLSLTKSASSSTWTALIGLCSLIVLLILATYSFIQKGFVYKLLYRISPQFEVLANEIRQGKFQKRPLIYTFACSIGVEVVGILHLYIAMQALGVPASVESCAAGYIIATLFFAISPFLRGLGAVEISLILVLQSYGMSQVEALSVTLLYRVFEFWLPLLAGIAAFFFVRGNIILRLLPGVLLALLGFVNIISVLTPPFRDRVRLLENFLPLDLIHFSSVAVLILGILLLCCAAFLVRGLRNAWWLALLFASLSFVGNITKGIDYEEASLALFTIIVLVFTRNNYRLKGDPHLQNFGIQTSLFILLAVLVYGTIGFYLLDKKDFNVDFSFWESIKSTFRSFILLDPDPEPVTRFGLGFVRSINFLGGISLALLVYVFIKPFIFHVTPLEQERAQAMQLLQRFGRTADDYFKTYPDKAYFFSKTTSGFIAYKTSGGFAIVLGEPVCTDDQQIIQQVIAEFERFCFDNGLKTAYYKIAEDRLSIFQSIGKKALPLGQEARLHLPSFSLEGKERKSLRNALNALQKKGYSAVVHAAPIKDGLLQKLKHVSDEWLTSMERKEIIFSSGMFDWEELKTQTIICIENTDEKVVAFLNIIPDYAPDEGTYDLIRKTEDAPAGVMDALIVAIIAELQLSEKQYLNMGMAAMSGIDKPQGLPEWVMKFAYERLRQFRHYQGLYDFKDKFGPQWETKYLIYENHYDLASLPLILSKIMKP